MFVRFVLSCVVAVGLVSSCVGQGALKIDPNDRTGATVKYFGWDAKLHGNLANSPKSAKWLFESCPANILRIPIRATASTSEGKVQFDAKGYGPLLDSIKMAKRINPDLKIFASTKLQNTKTFPDWMGTNQKGKIFGHDVRCPDAKKYAALLTDYFVQLANEGIKIDFLGLNNEIGGALTPKIYFEVANRLEANLERLDIPDDYKEFEWIGGEEFGVPGSVRYASTLQTNGASKYVDIVGSHFYPDKQSGSIESWRKLASLRVPTWHTEVHVRRHETAFENIAAVRDGMCIVFKTNQLGTEGYIWWDGTSHQGFLGNHIRKQMIQSMLYGGCVKTSGSYEAKDNEANKRVAQATRVGDTVYLWCFNPNEAVTQLPVELVNGQIEAAKATCFVGGRKVTSESMREVAVKTKGKNKLLVAEIPKNSIALVAIQLKDDKQLIPQKKWKQLEPKKRTFEASLIRVSGKKLYFKLRDGKSLQMPLESLSPEHFLEIKNSLRAHGIN